MDHIFWECRVARIAWYAIFSWFGLGAAFQTDFGSFISYAMEVKFSAQIVSLCKTAIITLIWALWKDMNKAMFDGTRPCTYGILAQVRVALREANSSFSLGSMSNAWTDLVILRLLGVSGNATISKQEVSISWWPPLPGWIKVNTDGSASGSPGAIHAGGVFRDASNKVLGCFHVHGGTGCAFEAELMGVIKAIEIAVARGWTKLWLKADSTYVVGLLDSISSKVPWRFAAFWSKTLEYISNMDFRVSHIFREGNAAADIMARPDSPEGFWPHAVPIIIDAVEIDFTVPRYFRWK